MNESVSVAARRMHARNVGTLIVVDDDQRPLGLVTDRDLVVRVLAESRNASQTTVGDVMSRLPHTVSPSSATTDVWSVF